jgi:deoxyribonuclease-1-like protein
VDQRSGQFRHPPLAAAFRARGPAPNEAFTFTLINVNTPSDRVDEELERLVQVFRTIRDDGRHEDDIVILGTLGTDDAHLGPLQQLPGATCAISAIPTTTRGNRQVDNILFDRRATVEFNHRCGVLDLRKEFNLTPQEEVEVSDHCPVWAEFSVYEGGER